LLSIGAIGVLAFGPARATPAEPAVPAAAERYVALAFARNLALQSQAIDLEQARARLAEARSAFQPRLDFIARYSVASGGRTIEIPAGDLLNSVYGTLNSYLRSQGQAPAFASVGNQSIPFLLDHEQQTNLRLVQPLWQPEISRNARASGAAAESRRALFGAYKRELRFAVLAGYFAWQQTEEAVAVLDSAARLTAEALRTDRALAGAEKITVDRVLRAEADDLAVREQLAGAVRDAHAARAQFNFLLNRPLGEPIDPAPEAELRRVAEAILATGPAGSLTGERREELQAGERAVAAAEAQEGAARARLYPTVGLAVEGGLQGQAYETSGDAKYVQASVVAQVNLWDGRQHRTELHQAELARRQAELALAQTREQLALEIERAADEFQAAVAGYRAATRRAEADGEAFRIVAQRAREGMANQLAFLDARNELTGAELGGAIARQRLLIAAAALDRATAATPVD
jgi:outer membrane protein TolC